MEDVGYIILIGRVDSMGTELEANNSYAEKRVEKICLNKYFLGWKEMLGLHEI